MFWIGLVSGIVLAVSWVIYGAWMANRMPYQDPLAKYMYEDVWSNVGVAFSATALMIAFPLLWAYGWIYRPYLRWKRRRAARRAAQDEA